MANKSASNLDMKSIEDKYAKLKYGKYSMDFDDKNVYWKKTTNQFVLDRKNDYIDDFIKTAHVSKKKSEASFKFQLDLLILSSPESQLLSLGCSRQFLDRLKRYITLLYPEKTLKTQKIQRPMSFDAIVKATRKEEEKTNNDLEGVDLDNLLIRFNENERFVDFITHYYGPIIAKIDAELGDKWHNPQLKRSKSYA